MKNKKLVVLAALSILFAAVVFAEGGYVVESVTGKVQYEVSPDTWKDVTVGMELSGSTVINTGLNSKLVLKNGDLTVTFKPMQKGTVEKLAASANAGKNGIKKGAAVTKSSVDKDTNGSKKAVQTASSRASEAKEDLEWEEE